MKLSSYVLSQHNNYVNGGVYTVIPVTKHGIFDLPFHLNRISDSADKIGIGDNTIFDRMHCFQKCLDACHEALHNRPVQEGLLALCWGQPMATSDTKASALFFPQKFVLYDKNFFVDTAPISRNPVDAKYSKWILERDPILKQRPIDVSETLMYRTIKNNHYFTEGFTSNLFVTTHKGEVISPPLTGHLRGSIQKLAVVLAALLDIEVKIQKLNIEDCPNWNGAFLTSGTKFVQPIHKILLDNVFTLENKYRNDISGQFYYTNDHIVKRLQNTMHEFLIKRTDIFTEILVGSTLGYSPFLVPSNEHIWGDELKSEFNLKYLSYCMEKARDLEKINTIEEDPFSLNSLQRMGKILDEENEDGENDDDDSDDSDYDDDDEDEEEIEDERDNEANNKIFNKSQAKEDFDNELLDFEREFLEKIKKEPYDSKKLLEDIDREDQENRNKEK